MKAEHRKELETNSLARGISHLWDRAKSGRLWNYRVIGLLLLVALVGGVWWYAVSQGRSAESQAWTRLIELFRSSGTESLNTFAEGHKDTTAGRVARLETARIKLGPEGLALLRERDREKQKKGIENLEAAREELKTLANEFKNDPTMQATCLLSAAEAELALVGVPRDASSPEHRGSVKAAAELYREVVRVVGENTPMGEKAKKRAEELEANAEQVKSVGERLYTLVSPTTGFTAPTPGSPAGPKAPEGPVTAPKPPEGTQPSEGPKPPTQPLTPPSTGAITGGVSAGPPPAQDPNKK